MCSIKAALQGVHVELSGVLGWVSKFAIYLSIIYLIITEIKISCHICRLDLEIPALINKKEENVLLEDYNGVVYNLATQETHLQLFLDCPFAVDCRGPFFQPSDGPFQILTSFRTQLGAPFLWRLLCQCVGPFGQSEMIQSLEIFGRLSCLLNATSRLILLGLYLEQRRFMVNG